MPAKGISIERLFRESARLIADVAENPVPVEKGMKRWFEYCDRVAPEKKRLWSQLKKLDYAADARRLTNWLSRLLAADPPPKSINGLWFGLFNPCPREDEVSCQAYLGGSKEFDPRSDSNEWVCQLKYRPKGGYANSQILPEIYAQVNPLEEHDLMYLGEPFLCHGYLALVVANWCHGPMRTKLLGSAKQRAVVMGHDSGDFYRMAVLEAESKTG
jgi:hypothetical protein